ncbi:EAL domain-containing protein [Undibacterium sp. KW1]|uniref:EAL domain-containing protein n=1 Tax=Undibacterium sp. KW1 TaxID=2058624 RepID=UPI00138A3087|nr:EAL domain-containing protein [Undibacterium sp. KW1]
MSPHPYLRKPMLFALLTFALTMLASAAIIVKLDEGSKQEERRLAYDLARSQAVNLQNNMYSALSASYALAAMVADGNGRVRHFGRFADKILQYHPQIAALYLAPDGVTSEVAPVEWSNKGLGIDLLADPIRKAEAQLAKDSHHLTLAGPLPLTNGSTGIIARLPVYLEDPIDANKAPQFWGLISAAIDLKTLLADTGLSKLSERGYDYELSRVHPDTRARQVIEKSAGFATTNYLSYAIKLPNAEWTLELTPKNSIIQNKPRLLYNSVGLLFSFMLACLVKLLLEAREQRKNLKKIVSKRTAELAQRETDLHHAQIISKTGNWSIGNNAEEWRYSDEARRILGYANGSRIDCASLMQRIHPDDIHAVKIFWSQVQAGKDAGIEHRIIIDGEVRWLHSQYDAQSARHMGTVQDITERKHVEEDLRIAAIAFEAQEGMVITDERRSIVRVNQAFTRITGYSREEALGKQTSLLKSGLHGASYYEEMGKQLDANAYWQGEIWNRRKNGEVYPEWLTITAVKNASGKVVNYVATMLDITQRKATEAKLEHLAYHDPLTGLANRRLLIDRLQHSLLAKSRSNLYGAVLFLDLDNFKTINDSSGHGKGDMLLQVAAKRLAHSIRKGDTLARYGGDEFVLLLEELSDNVRETAIEVQMIVTKILADLRAPYDLEHSEYHSSASIGITLFDKQSTSAEELLKQVEVAMYEAKSSGGNNFRFFDKDMLDIVNTRAALEADMRQGLQQEQFVLHYQPQVSSTGQVTGAEALVRWQHPHKGLVPPSDFIPLAEESGLILSLGAWILKTACAKLAEWQNNDDTKNRTLAVNVSARQFRQNDFVSLVLDNIRHYQIDASKLKLELTESLLVDNVEETIDKMNQLKARGVGFSLDDFGTGYSSLSYLKRLPLDQLKIDQSFVRDILNNNNDAVITRTIIALGQSLGLAVIAEGVETADQRDFLLQQGCLSYQGYLYGKPSANLI